jgi:hypothetical protein
VAAAAAHGPVNTSPGAGPVGEDLVGRCLDIWSDLDTAWFEAAVEVRTGWGPNLNFIG